MHSTNRLNVWTVRLEKPQKAGRSRSLPLTTLGSGLLPGNVGDSVEGDVTADKVTGEDGELVSSTEAGLVQDTSWGPLFMRVLISECVKL